MQLESAMAGSVGRTANTECVLFRVGERPAIAGSKTSGILERISSIESVAVLNGQCFECLRGTDNRKCDECQRGTDTGICDECTRGTDIGQCDEWHCWMAMRAVQETNTRFVCMIRITLNCE